MVAAHNVGEDFCRRYSPLQSVGNEEIIYTPACVILSRVEAVRPPGVADRVGIKVAEAVGKAGFQQGSVAASKEQIRAFFEDLKTEDK